MTQRLPESTYKLEFQQLVSRSGPPPANDLTQTRLPNRFWASLGHKGMTSRRYCIPCRWTGLSHLYMSVSESQIERRRNSYTITWAQLMLNLWLDGWWNYFKNDIRCPFSCRVIRRKGIPSVQTSAPSSLRSLFPWHSRTFFAGSDTKSSQTRQITGVHTINMCSIYIQYRI